jgi:hypothetical protein
VRRWVVGVFFSTLALLGLAAAGLLGRMLLHSAIYEGWRHLYFVYLAFVLIATWAGERCGGPGHWARDAGAPLMLLALGVAQVLWRIVAEHPFQYAYFSFLPGKVIE